MSSLNPTTQSSVENKSNERQYKCTKCGNFTFVYKSHLKRHAVVYIEENDFPCTKYNLEGRTVYICI